MEKTIKKIQEDLKYGLATAARGYLKIGLDHYHKKLGYYEVFPQVLIGNLAISVELMLKAFIASQKIDLLFKDLPLGLKAMLSAPSLFTVKDIRPLEIELRSSKYKTLELNECISLFYIFFPEQKQNLGAHFRFLTSCRNTSLHSILPKFQKYELDRTVYLSLNLFQILEKKNTFDLKKYVLTPEDKKFLTKFDSDRVERVEKAIASAREKAKKINEPDIISVSEWDVIDTTCPVCESTGLLFGDTVEGYNDPESGPMLLFIPDSFECKACGLKLSDALELELAGMAKSYDRSRDIVSCFGDRDFGYDYY